VQVLFEHGKFTHEATLMTSWAMLFFSLGLFAYASVKILASAFYAYQNTRTPVVVAACCVTINVVLNLLLMHLMRVGGLALSTAVASWTNATVLYILLRRRIGLLGGRRIMRCLVKAVIASAGMIFFCHIIMNAPVTLPLVIRLLLAIVGGTAVYL